MNRVATKPAVLSLAISAALAGLSWQAAAEQAQSSAIESKTAVQPEQQAAAKNDKDVEVIQVSGIRSSIKESLFQKQNATSVVDLVVSDDIGKFPDENLAEALQRIPGITITRNGGEGQNILVRGLGGGYNITTLNGRKLASEYAGRDFNFDTIASELVSVLRVYKSPEAQLPEGGIGAVIDIETRKPLDMDGTTISASAKGIYESRTEDTHPHASFIYGQKNEDDTFGGLFSAVYSKKTLRADTYSASGFFDEDEGWGVDSAGVPVDTNENGVIDTGETYASKIPSYMYFANAQDVRERLGATLALQWRPTDQLDINFDSLYSRYNTDGNRYQIGFVNYDETHTPGTPLFSDATFDDMDRVIKMRQTGDNTMVELLNISTPRKTDTYQLGLNTKYQYNEQWSFTVDAAYSEAKDQNAGDNRFIVARGFVDAIDIDYSSGNKLPDVVISPGLTADQDYGAHYSYNSGTGVTDKISDLKLLSTYLPEDGLITKVDAGLTYVNQQKGQNQFASANASQFSRGGFYLARDGYAFDNSTVFQKGEFELFRIPADVFVPANFDNFLDGENSLSPSPWPSFDYDKLLAYYRGINAEAADKSIVAVQDRAGSYEVEEAVSTAFVQVTMEPELFGLSSMLNLGLRGSKTDVTSSGFGYDLAKVELDAGGLPTNNDWRQVLPVSYDDSYNNILPSLNFKLNLTDELLVRFSAAQVLSRPSLYYLRSWAAPNFTVREQGLPTLAMGNPGVKPEEANQADLTLEWYYGESSALSGGVFVKDIKSFVTEGKFAANVAGTDYLVTTSVNGEYGAKVEGYEMAWQQSLQELLPEPFNGLGFQLNYTYVDSSYDDPDLKAKNLPFQGMSKNSYNAVVYYEQYGVQARLAYNWRSKFVTNPEDWGGASWIASYGQLDASVSYDIMHGLTVFAEASNLSNSRYWGYVKREDQVNYLERFGTQLAVGIRGSF
ncbi:MAG TPA: TonB-dependent receptor [Rheinheimera sp.]|uniref:TonB-dependent receptor n=1 Tax=Rheinheimera sp. TaxID=1869214 RepID=UPI002B4A4C00|nr:TonB-dependent receptor [Rheinheimera sp.]HJS16924.1 TonB-dependent receptor [Rheinheimera sp.]